MFGCVERHYNNKPVQRERDRIKKDDDMTARIAELESNGGVTQNAVFEGCTQTGSANALELRKPSEQRETDLGKTALTLVRRVALQAQQKRERDQYVIELNRLGRAIYKQRI
ncbi:hypothetical protein DPEC_G00141900 [Dallia pectoralis]|uniref:Uncharacterized protein n=1 Tax=Dallia pectoralis TaxID=75939 RepID=A0ACC2GN67_DALPE|nr:hypothetical protein DPEC_G00141900 [Dallia pectoralis]